MANYTVDQLFEKHQAETQAWVEAERHALTIKMMARHPVGTAIDGRITQTITVNGHPAERSTPIKGVIKAMDYQAGTVDIEANGDIVTGVPVLRLSGMVSPGPSLCNMSQPAKQPWWKFWA